MLPVLPVLPVLPALPWAEVALPAAGQLLRAAAVVALTVVGLLLRWWLVRRVLTTRVAIRMVPTDTCEISAEDVTRVAAQLQRVRPAVSVTPRRAHAVRFLIRNLPGGQMAVEMHGPGRAGSVLRLAAYPEVELEPVHPAAEPETGPRLPGAGVAVAPTPGRSVVDESAAGQATR